MDGNPQSPADLIKASLQPWQTALADPDAAQRKVLSDLLQIYARTEYGAGYNAGNIDSTGEYRRSFPVVTYDDYKPIILKVMAGDIKLLLHEDPLGWAITRGTTQDEPKFIPMTPTDIKTRASAGRAMMNYAAVSNDFSLFRGVNSAGH